MAAHRLRFQPGPPSIKACGKDTSVVKNQEIGGTKQVGEIPELLVLSGAGTAREQQQPRAGAVRQRLLRDKFRGQLVMEIGDQHACLIIRTDAATCAELTVFSAPMADVSLETMRA